MRSPVNASTDRSTLVSHAPHRLQPRRRHRSKRPHPPRRSQRRPRPRQLRPPTSPPRQNDSFPLARNHGKPHQRRRRIPNHRLPRLPQSGLISEVGSVSRGLFAIFRVENPLISHSFYLRSLASICGYLFCFSFSRKGGDQQAVFSFTRLPNNAKTLEHGAPS